MVQGSGGFRLLCSIAALGFLAREGNRGAYTLAHEFHQTGDHPFVRVDTGTAQHFTAIAGARPAGDLLGAVAVFLVVRNCVIKCCQYHGSEQFAGTVALLVIKSSAINEISQLVVLSVILALVILA